MGVFRYRVRRLVTTAGTSAPSAPYAVPVFWDIIEVKVMPAADTAKHGVRWLKHILLLVVQSLSGRPP